MKKLNFSIFLLVLFSSFLLSQNYYRRKSNYPRYFNPESIITTKGKIIGVDSIKMRNISIVRLNIQTKSGPIYIHIAPYWYLEKQKVLFKVNTPISITGSKIIYENKATIIASEFVYENKSVKLRDSNGFPVWAGQGNNRGNGMGKGRGNGRGRRF